jgi:myo-inositol-1(or 4)-monophosphatase
VSEANRELERELARIARQAGTELRARFGRTRTVTKKGAIDLVTDADRAAEELILRELAGSFPGTPILAEESGAIGHPAAGQLRLLVDPLDGTTNYAHAIPHFSTTIAAVDSAGVLAGVVYDPIRDEMYAGTRGAGAFCNGSPLRIIGDARLDDAVLATGFPYDVRARADEVLRRFGQFLQKARAIRRFGSAALDLAWVAQGRYDGYWEGGLKPWDVAAGALVVSEAGGVVSGFDGEPLDLMGGRCVAASPGLHAEMMVLTRTSNA